MKLYTRDTTGWRMLTWQARCVLLHAFRKVDRSGAIDLDGDGLDGLAVMLDLPDDVVMEGILGRRGLVERGVAEIHEEGERAIFVLPKYQEAQEARQSAKARKRMSREKALETFGTSREGGDGETIRKLSARSAGPGTVYFIGDSPLTTVKIGFTSGDVRDRLDGLQVGSPTSLRLVASLPGSLGDEQELHERFSAYRTSGEWFRVEGELARFIESQNVTELSKSDRSASHAVTLGHTRSRSDQNRSEQNRKRERARAHEPDECSAVDPLDLGPDSSAATGPRIDEATPPATPGHAETEAALQGPAGEISDPVNSDPLTRPMDTWARPAFESLRMSMGDRDVDPQLEWISWMGHIVSERANSGRVIAVERGGWTKWLTNAFRRAPIAKRPQAEAPVKKFKPLEARPSDEEIAKNLAAAQAMIDRLDEEDRPQNEEDPEVA